MSNTSVKMAREITGQKKAQKDVSLNVDIEDASIDQPYPTTEPVHIDWTSEEERWAKRKFDWMVLPLLILGFFSQQVDRGNIGPALTSTMLEDLNLNQDIVANGQTCLYIMIVAFELPSNLLLQRIGAKLWIPCQMILWGLVATLHAEIKGTASFYVCRIFLGITEAGFIPGSVYYISTFYTKKDFAVRASFFWIGSYLGKACGSLFAAGLLKLHGKFGRPGWQWLFLVEGVMSILIGIIALVWWPRSTSDTRTLIPGLRLLSPREEHILTNMIILDDPAKKNASKIRITFKDVVRTIANWRLLTFLVFIITYVAPITCMDTYNSQITKEIGFDTVRANLLASVATWTAIPLVLLGGKMAAVTGRYGMCMLIFQIPDLVLSGVFRYLQAKGDASVWARYGVYQSIIAVACPPYILGLVWLTSNTRTPLQRSVYSSLYVMFTNTSNSFATQMFRAEDKPKYLKGLIAVLGLHSFAVLWVAFSIFIFWYANKEALGDAGLPEVTAEVEIGDGDNAAGVTVSKKFRYVY